VPASMSGQMNSVAPRPGVPVGVMSRPGAPNNMPGAGQSLLSGASRMPSTMPGHPGPNSYPPTQYRGPGPHLLPVSLDEFVHYILSQCFLFWGKFTPWG